jgi:hypothetical protein
VLEDQCEDGRPEVLDDGRLRRSHVVEHGLGRRGDDIRRDLARLRRPLADRLGLPLLHRLLDDLAVDRALQAPGQETA